MTSTSLISLFNDHLVDFVFQHPDGSYEPVEWPKDATHQLTPTSWNYRKLYKPNKSGKIQMPKGFALSVCAVPLTRKHQLRGPAIHATRPLPDGRMVYNKAAELGGKKRVLRWMVEEMRARVKKGFINDATDAQCDTLYRNLIIADRLLRS